MSSGRGERARPSSASAPRPQWRQAPLRTMSCSQWPQARHTPSRRAACAQVASPVPGGTGKVGATPQLRTLDWVMVEVLERGDVTFFIRPRVQDASTDAPPPPTIDGIQAFFMVLGAGREHRRVRIGKKALPARRGQRFWAHVESVGTLERVLRYQLEGETYTTKTRGERYQPPARPIAQGEYALVVHDDHTHLVYRVDALDELADELLPGTRGSFILLFKATHGRATWSTAGYAPDTLSTYDAQLVLVGAGEGHDDEAAVHAAFEPEPVLATAADALD